MKKYTIKENDSGQRLDKFVFKLAPALPKPLFFKAVRKKDVKLNGKRTESSTILTTGDVVELYIHSKFFAEDDHSFLNAPSALDVLYEDENILIVNKPVGTLMHQSVKQDTDNLNSRMLHYLYNKGDFNPKEEQSFVPAFCNRLDRNTGGLVIAGKNFSTLQILNEKMKKREITRKYLTVVSGIPENDTDILKDFHKKNTDINKAIISDTEKPDFSNIETRYKVLEKNTNTSLLDVELITGRFHQIRAHLAYIGHPIIGDRKYGDTSKVRNQKLIAYYIGFDFETSSKHLDYLRGKSFAIDMEKAKNYLL